MKISFTKSAPALLGACTISILASLAPATVEARGLFQIPSQFGGFSVLAWEAPVTADADVAIDVQMNVVCNTSNGIQIEIRDDVSVLDSATVLDTFSYSATLSLEAGDRIYFAVAAGGSDNFCDNTLVEFAVQQDAVSYDAGLDFSVTTQGNNGWYYLADFGSYEEMSWAVNWWGFESWVHGVFDGSGNALSETTVFRPFLDSDGDGVDDSADLCPLTDAGAPVDANGCSDDEVDTDGDGVCDLGAPSAGPSGCTGSDNCPLDANAGQEDNDVDGDGDACDSDDDNDGVPDSSDNCPLTLGGNADQTDSDGDYAGDICDSDLDGDGVDNNVDVCPFDPDPDQTDTDMDGDGDACDANDDNDLFDDVDDNCPIDVNDGQEDLDGDLIGDACDADLDGDGIDNNVDNCPETVGGNGDQTDTDFDGDGNVCDTDDDNDTVLDGVDNCPLTANPSQSDADGDGTGDVCNDADDADGDDWSDVLDNCPNVANGNQADLDGDGTGDACDTDIDGDGVDNGQDNCAATPLGETSGANGCTIAQLCPCEGPQGTTNAWKNHGKYVSCVAHAANGFRDAGLISGSERGDIVSAAGQSDCGHRN